MGKLVPQGGAIASKQALFFTFGLSFRIFPLSVKNVA